MTDECAQKLTDRPYANAKKKWCEELVEQVTYEKWCHLQESGEFRPILHTGHRPSITAQW
jgi:hypothetical protein